MISGSVTPAADRALVAVVGRLVNSAGLHWRHHGIGLLQAYIVEGPVEHRLHVWHPELRFVDEDSGMLHDHRFDLRSQVLLGAIHDTEVEVVEERYPEILPEGVVTYRAWDVENARQAIARGASPRSGGGVVPPTGGSHGGEGPPETSAWVRLKDDRTYTIRMSQNVFGQGSVYQYQARKFHRSETHGLTVTLCTKTNQRDVPARILARTGKTPSHGIGAPVLSVDPRRKYLEQAALRLERIGRGES